MTAGQRTGFVLCHGFTGHPASMRPWADFLEERGYPVDVPLLPGHGTTWQDLNTKKWTDFYDALEQSFLQMSIECDRVVVGGLSMGGALATRLAEVLQPAGIVLVNPSIYTDRFDAKFAGLASRFIPSTTSIGDDIKKPGVSENAYPRSPLRTFASLQQLWKVTRRDLSRISCPILLLRSVDDHVAPGPHTSRLIEQGATNAPFREVLLHNSYHVATLDNDAKTIFQASVDFERGLSIP